MANDEGPRIPPPPMVRPPGQFPGGQRIPPPPGVRPPGSGGAHGPGPMQMLPKIIQQSSRIRDITPQKLLTEADCIQKLTTYAAFSIRKVPAISPKEKPSWARAEVTEDRLDQVDIKKQIKKLGEKAKTVAEKRAALAQFQQGQVTALLDDLATKEPDVNFEWSLVQMDRIEKEVPSSKPGKKAIETVVMILYVKRAPIPGLNAVMLFQNIEKKRIDSLRPVPPPPPPPQQQQQPPPPPPHHEQRPTTPHGKMGGGQPVFVNLNGQNKPKTKQRDKKYHDRNDSGSSNSSDSYDTASDSGSDGSSSFGTSISSRSDQRHRRRNSKAPTRSHGSRHGPRYPSQDRILSPEPRRPSEAYGVPHHPQHPQQHPQQHSQQHSQQHPQQHHQGPPPQRPYVPEVPRMVPAIDPITSAYQAGIEDARAEFGERIQSPVPPQPVIIERIIERPIERTAIERVIERPPLDRIIESPRAVVSYSRLPERPRFAERYHEDRYAHDVRSQEDRFFIHRREAEDNAIMREERRRREAEEYIDQRPLERPDLTDWGQSFSLQGDSSPELSPTREGFGRRQSESRDRDFSRPEPPRRFFSSPVQPHPFAPSLPRRYPPSTSSRTYSDAGW